jgi:hypothetical protein
MLVYKIQGDSDIKFASAVLSPNTCGQDPGRFSWTVLCAQKAVSQHAVVHQMLADKRQGDFSGPSIVFMKTIIKMRLCIRCLYVSARAISVDHPLCSLR